MRFRKTYLVIIVVFVVFSMVASAIPYKTTIIMDSDDGTEVDETTWYKNGYSLCNNYMGSYQGDMYGVGLRFHVDNLTQGERITYARLRLASWGGSITSSLKLLIEGVLQDSPTAFNQTERPSQKLPKTRNKIEWKINKNWDKGRYSVPLYYSSPNIAPIINEILSLPNWGNGSEGKTLIITIKELVKSSDTNYVTFVDYHKSSDPKMKSPAVLEIYKTVYDTFIGKELLGRPTDRSVTINLYSLIDTDVYVEYGTTPGRYTYITRCYLNNPAEKAIEIKLNRLRPDTQYYYRIAYRKAGVGRFEKGVEHSFHTQRAKGSSFVFAIQADEHLQAMYKLPTNPSNMKLYKMTLENIANANPDFFISLGDFAHTEYLKGRNAKTLQEAIDRYLMQRQYIDTIGHSIPFYLTLGNHEGENGWYYKEPYNNSLAVWSVKARKETILNPYPDEFYTGNIDQLSYVGLREDYYAWEWGDALFVVLDPYWYSVKKPHDHKPHNLPGTHNGWDWTLGEEQYNWLYDTLSNSSAKWKFIFIHQLKSDILSSEYRFLPDAKQLRGSSVCWENPDSAALPDRNRHVYCKQHHRVL